MTSRREFLKSAALLTGAMGVSGTIPAAIQRAVAINPAAGTTYLDAEHVVILMQENRSFDHCYGSLQGVRGFDDPRAIQLPNKNVVWLQSNLLGETYAPFRFDIKNSKATWMSSLPHSWENQVDARNEGKHNRWLDVKKSGNEEYAAMPLTMGYYNREDVPFYYSLADAFTVCDQNFCSSLTGTSPNRSYLWTDTIREKQNENSRAYVWNEQFDPGLCAWKTFPERLEENSISWKIYQNELYLDVGLGDATPWLDNFGDNPMEYFEQYHVKFLPAYINYLPKKIARLEQEIADAEKKINELTNEEKEKLTKAIQEKQQQLARTREEKEKYTLANYEKLSDAEKKLHEKAFVTNVNDPNYHQLETLSYTEGAEKREIKIPKGDIFHEFRKDVKSNKLPAVSWLVAPEKFSDHPGAPWFGAWYVSEAMNILTENPDVWKKTIFILCYDENDGYFDHVPPFTAPNPYSKETGDVSKSIDGKVEFVTKEQDLKSTPEKHARESSIGLGYRVPLVIASPWSRGGMVCSQVFDHTSILQFLEKFLSHKSGKKIQETNISSWRRAVCGDLTSVFQPYKGEPIKFPIVLEKKEFVESIYNAKFKKLPNDFVKLSSEEIETINQHPATSTLLPHQEKGMRTSQALPYQLYVDGNLQPDKSSFEIEFKSGKDFFGEQSAGSPFLVYRPGANMKTWAYAVAAGEALANTWPLKDFENENYFLRVYGPNGFFREFVGNAQDPDAKITCAYEQAKKKPTGNLLLKIENHGNSPLTFQINHHAYDYSTQTKTIGAAKSELIIFPLEKSFGWYDLSVVVSGAVFSKRFAGRVETGRTGFTDPVIGI